MARENKLFQYSAMAISFLFVREADAEAVYTNIDPDTIINEDLELVRIDMDNNGTFDFAFLKSTGIGYTYWSDEYLYFYYMHVSPQISGNAIAGLKSVIDPSYGGFTLYYPYAIEENVLIDDKLSFQNDFYQVIAARILNEDGIAIEIRGTWYPELTDHYLGVEFLDEVGCKHYGWLRCDVKSKGDTLIIKDYAYETKCNVGIFAGDTIGDTTAVDIMENTLANVNIYSYKNDVIVNVGALQDYTEIVITDLNGKIIYSNYLMYNTNKITLDDSLIGYYIVKITSENKQFAKMIFIN